MKRLLAIIVLLIAVGASNGAEALSLTAAPTQLLEAMNSSDTQFVGVMPKQGIYADKGELECCWNSFCSCATNCNHGSATFALMISEPAESLLAPLRGKFAVGIQTMPILSVAYTIIDPPRA